MFRKNGNTNGGYGAYKIYGSINPKMMTDKIAIV